MALSKNTKFYYDFQSEDRGKTTGFKNNYRLWFIPGDNTDLSSPAIVKFPDFTIKREFKGSSKMPNEMPQGMRETDQFKISFNLSEFKDIGANDWTTVRNWILDAKSATERTVNGISMYIPNVWYLMSDNWQGDKTYDTLHFSGCQDKRPVKKIKSDTKTGLVGFSITCNSMFRVVTEKLQVAEAVTGGVKTGVSTLLKYTDSGSTVEVRNKTIGSGSYVHASIASIFSQINTDGTNIFDAIMRESTSFGNTDTFFSHIIYHRQYELQANYPGAALGENNLNLNIKIYNSANDDVAGMLAPNDANGINKSNNYFDFVRYNSDSQFCKAIPVMTNELTIDLKFIPIFADLSSAKTLTADDCLTTEIEILNSEKLIVQSTSYLTNIGKITEGLQNQTMTNEYMNLDRIFSDNEGILTEDSEEAELTIHNQMILVKPTFFNGYFSEEAIIKTPIYLHSGFDYWKVHDFLTLNVGSGLTFEPKVSDMTATPNPTPLSACLSQGYSLNQAIAERMKVSGWGYIRALAATSVYGRDNVGIISFEMRHEDCQQNNVGGNYVFTSGMFQKAGSYIDRLISNKAVLVEVEVDYISGRSKAKFFIRDDDGV